MMGGTPIKLWASTKERIDKLQASLQGYLCKVLKACPPAGVPKTVIIDALVRFCLNKDPDTLFRGISLWLGKKGNNVKGKLVSVRILDETKEGLDHLRGKIIETFLNKAQDLGLHDFQPNDLKESLRALLSYPNLFDIALEIFKPEVFIEETTNAIDKDSGSKLSPPYYRFVSMIMERIGKSITFEDPSTKVMLFLKRVEEEESRRRRLEALIRRGKELLQRLEGRFIKARLRIGEHGGYFIAVPQDINLLRDFVAMLRASEKEKHEIVANVEFELGGRTYILKGLKIRGYQSSLYESLIPPGWMSGELPGIEIGDFNDLPPDLQTALNTTPINVDATIYNTHLVKET
jgi:hypothetical protein